MAAQSVYEKFDAVMAAAAEGPCPGGHKAIIEKLSELAQYLPQFPAIQNMNPAQHINWCRKALVTEVTISLLDRRAKPGSDVMDAAEQEDFERAWKQCLWHLRRASGIGGSEIGTIVLNMSRQESGEFGSAHNTVKEKLLMMAPQIGEPAMRRGHQMEDYVRSIHHKSSGEVEDVSSLRALRGFRSPDHPFIIGTPDDITLRGDGKNTKKERVLLDYKCPGQEVLEKYKKSGVPFGYIAQLHHYNIVAQDAGIKINAFQLVPFDYHGGANTLIMPVKHDPELEAEIKRTGEVLWNDFVMKGEIPAPMKAPELIVNSVELGDSMRKAGVMHAISSELAKRAEEMKAEAIMMADRTVDKKSLGRIDAGFYYISRDAVWDEEALKELAAKADIDPNKYYKPSSGRVNQKNTASMLAHVQSLMESREKGAGVEILKTLKEGLKGAVIMELDMESLAKDIQDAGVDVSFAYSIREKAGLTMKKNGPDAEQKSIVMVNAANLLNDISEMVDLRIDDFIGDTGPEDQIPDEGITF